MTEHSKAWEKGREAAMSSSSRKPPKTASAKWQEEYWQGHAAGKEEAKAGWAEFLAAHPSLAKQVGAR